MLFRSVLGRGTAGVRLFNVDDNEHVVGAAKIEEADEDGEDVSAESTAPDIGEAN